jgi:hypothetical protein
LTAFGRHDVMTSVPEDQLNGVADEDFIIDDKDAGHGLPFPAKFRIEHMPHTRTTDTNANETAHRKSTWTRANTEMMSEYRRFSTVLEYALTRTHRPRPQIIWWRPGPA